MLVESMIKLSFLLWGGLVVARTWAFQVRPSVGVRRPAFAPPLSAVVDFQEGTARDVGAFYDWAMESGVQSIDGFQLTSEDGVDFSVMTTEPLQEGTAILFVPNEMILSSMGARQEFGGNLQEAIEQLGRLGANDQVPEFCLFCKILAEYERGEESPWYAWLNSLPRLYYNAVSMTSFCYECLPPLVFALARSERLKFDNFCEVLQKVGGLSPQTKSNNDLAKWAFNVVTTRCWGSNDEKFIIPMADMVNHGTETEVDFRFDENGLIVYTTKDVDAGSPLRRSYGDPTNPSFLFATYGFLDQTSPATFCKIMTIKPNQELLDLGLDFSRMLFYKDTGDISDEVWDVMLYQALASDRETQQAFYEAHMRNDLDTKRAIHQEHFLETSTALKNHVDTFLKQLDELSAKAVGKDINEHPRLPLILNHNDFVKETFLRVKDRLDPMVAQAAGEPVNA